MVFPQLTKKGMDSTLQLQSNVLNFYTKNPRMVPDDLQPKCHKMFITVTEPVSKAATKNIGKKKSAMQQITSNCAHFVTQVVVLLHYKPLHLIIKLLL